MPARISFAVAVTLFLLVWAGWFTIRGWTDNPAVYLTVEGLWIVTLYLTTERIQKAAQRFEDWEEHVYVETTHVDASIPFCRCRTYVLLDGPLIIAEAKAHTKPRCYNWHNEGIKPPHVERDHFSRSLVRPARRIHPHHGKRRPAPGPGRREAAAD